MNFRKTAALLGSAVMLMSLVGCGENVVYKEMREPIDNALTAVSTHDGKLLSQSYFSGEQIKFEAEMWSGVSVDEYFDTFSVYLRNVDDYYKQTYGEDYVLEYHDGVLVELEDENYDEINQKYADESNGKRKYKYNKGYIDYGTLSIKGSLGEDSKEVDVMLINSDREGWKCYMTDTFFAYFYSDSQ